MNTVSIRFFDLILSVTGLVLFSPIMLLILLIGFFQAGSPIFRQERLGKKQSLFILLKFRTMSVDTASVATHLVRPDSITRFGHFLRRTKLDELPQLWNVLIGEMSVVGPRPGLPSQRVLTEAREKLGVFDVKPGITGLAQIKGVDMSTPTPLAKIDSEMIDTMSTKNYFKYVFFTILGKGQGDRLKVH